jgi:hypothetical protein
MRTGIVLAVAVAMTLACPAAIAEEWLSLSKTSDSHPTEMFLDLASITVKTNIRIAEMKFVPLLPWADGTQLLDGAVPAVDCWWKFRTVSGSRLLDRSSRTCQIV